MMFNKVSVSVVTLRFFFSSFPFLFPFIANYSDIDTSIAAAWH